MRLLSIIIGLIILYESVNTYDDEELDNANEWLNQIYNETSVIIDRFGDETASQGRQLCTSPTKQNGTCVKKELCLDAAPPVNSTTQFILRERDTCTTSEICCMQLSVDLTIVTPTGKPIKSSTKGRQLCTSSTKQNGTCVKKELCLDAAPPVNSTTQFILRERDTCTTSEICCMQLSVDLTIVTPTGKPIESSTKAKTTCTTDQREEGICVKMSLCSNAEQTVDATTLIIPRGGNACPNYEACCLESNVKNTTIKVTNGCGFSNSGANIFREKTSASGLADYGEFPWMIALIRKENEKNSWNESYSGGGALIHPSVVITAAHKVIKFKPTELKVRAGEWDTRTEAEVEPYQEIDVNKIIIHEKYLSAHAHNNVALLILKSPVDLIDAPHIGVACLAPQLPPPGTRCFSMGWGSDFLNKDSYAVILKKLELPLVEASVCEKQYQGTRLGLDYRLDKSLTCAGGEEGVDTCIGDGGSPLVCQVAGQSERFAVVGMVAYGLGCGIEHLPGVYVNVPNLYDWVGNQLTSEQLKKASFVY